ncbi:MAG: dihydroorotase [Clostridia bacterium]|nr:dihydroorotase [Clostridia bacterium]
MDRLYNAQIIHTPNQPKGETLDFSSVSDLRTFDKTEYTAIPGFCDVHVHFREPGFSCKEDMATGSAAAVRGGYTAVCTMPNLNPVPDSVSHLQEQLNAIDEKATVAVYPYGAITVNELGNTLADLEGMADKVIAFSDDGRGVQSDEMMREAMIKAKKLGKIIAAHTEVDALKGGCIHAGEFAKEHGYTGIPSACEYLQIERDLKLVREIGCAYHVCHVSAKESVELIRKAKAEGLDVTCETAPHYLIFSDKDLQEDGKWKMNPPLRGEEDRKALIEGILDGTVDMIATDHAPHTAEEKSRGLEKSLFGIVGLETAFPALYTHLVKPGILTLEKVIDLMAYAPRRRFGIPLGNDWSLWDLNAEQTVNPETFASKGRATPFEGMTLQGKHVLTVRDGKIL